MKICDYRKKPVVISAAHYTGPGDLAALTDWAGRADLRLDGNAAIIPTLEGDMLAQPGDIIIRGVAGEIYPCKPDIFARTYEVVTP